MKAEGDPVMGSNVFYLYSSKALRVFLLILLVASTPSTILFSASYASSSGPSKASTGSLVLEYGFEGYAFLLDARGRVATTVLRLISSEPFGVVRVEDTIIYVNCSYPVSHPLIKAIGGEDYLLSTKCYIRVPLLWKLNGRVYVYNESVGYRIIVEANLSNYYGLNKSLRMISLTENKTVLRIVREDYDKYRLLNGTSIRIVITANGRKVVVNNTPSTFNPFFVTYPLTAREAAELVERGEKLYYLGIPVVVSPWSERKGGAPSDWLTAYAGVPLGKYYANLSSSKDLYATSWVYYIAPLYKGYAFTQYIQLRAVIKPGEIEEIVAKANITHSYGEYMAYNYAPQPPIEFAAQAPVDVISMYKLHYPIRLLYVPVPLPRAMDKYGAMLVFTVTKIYYTYPSGFDPSSLDIGPIPAPHQESQSRTILIGVFAAIIAVVIILLLVRRKKAWKGV